MENSLISVIVPVYNVEPYLRQCLDSIISQTYRNIEIIVIDDGSTDGCPQICDEYRERDGRVVIFHTENRGLSAARNLGIDKARGEWIMFVDSDDWVEPDYCRLPYEAAVEHDADLVIFSIILEGSTEESQKQDNNISGVLSAREAVVNGRPAAWNKFYHRSLFNMVRYPEGRLFEDIATTHRIIYQAKKIIFLNERLYHYRIRKDSLSHKKDKRFYRELFRAYLQRYEDLLSYGFPREKMEQKMLSESLHFLLRMEPGDDPLLARAEAIVSAYTGETECLESLERDALKVWQLNKQLFHFYYRIRGWKIDDAHEEESARLNP